MFLDKREFHYDKFTEIIEGIHNNSRSPSGYIETHWDSSIFIRKMLTERSVGDLTEGDDDVSVIGRFVLGVHIIHRYVHDSGSYGLRYLWTRSSIREIDKSSIRLTL